MDRAADHNDIPPLLNPPRRSTTPPQVLAVVAAAIVGAYLSTGLNLPFLRCSFKAITGWPCPFCGGTRALRAIAHFQWAKAFWWNPLVTFGVIAGAVWFVAWMILSPSNFDRRMKSIQRWPWVAIGIVIVALNWIFVLRFLPR